MKKESISNEPLIYTTGAFLRPMKLKNSQGDELWFWSVSEFTDDSFKNGKVFNPNEFSKSKENLLEEVI